MSGYVTGQARAGDESASPVVGGDEYPDAQQSRFRASDAAAPTTTPIPIDPPTAPTLLGVADALRGSSALLLWNLVPQTPPAGHSHPSVFTDYAWRWEKHTGTPDPPLGMSPYMSVDVNGLRVEQQLIPSGGGSYTGFPKPRLVLANTGPLVDSTNTPIYTLVIEWSSEAVTVDGVPPTLSSASMSPPALPRLTNQPIIGNSYTNGPWELYCAWSGTWIGVPGAWTLALTSRLILSYGGSGGTTVAVAINGKSSGTDYLEFDNTAHTILLVGATTSGTPPTSGLGTPISTGGSGTPGAWPGDQTGYQQEFGAGNLGPYYWSLWRQLNGYLYGVAVVPLSAADTVSLVSDRTLVPGTGPVVPNLRFRAGSHPSPSLSAQLSEYTHYWPLDDASPGPMYDLLAGSYLTVVNPSIATFRADGITNPLAPTHTKGIRLGQVGASKAYLSWGGLGPRPGLGTGATGHDLTIACWVRWEGPVGGGQQREVIRSTDAIFGVPALTVTIWPYAEPFGVQFETYDSVGHALKTLRTFGFDWPSEYLLDLGDPMSPWDVPIPYKGPLWAYLTVVLRTVSGHMTMEIWVDGVLLASQAGVDTGWGLDSQLRWVGRGIQPCTLQHLTIWPFALDPAAISGAGA